MQIELYTFVYNNEDLLPFFLDHYEPIVNKITFIDSNSDDSTLELIHNHEVIQTGLTWWDWDSLHNIRDNIWRESDFDYVMFPDLDEFFYKPNIREFIEKSKADIYQMQGFQMISKNFPKRGTKITEINMGIPLPLHSKYTIFKPTSDIRFVDAHNIETNSKNINRMEIKLLHYKYLGAEHMLKRSLKIKDRVPIGSFCKNIGSNILEKFSGFVKNIEEHEIEIQDILVRAKKVI